MIGSEEFFNHRIEVLGITVDRRPKGRPRKRESKIIKKIGYVPYFNNRGIGIKL